MVGWLGLINQSIKSADDLILIGSPVRSVRSADMSK